MCILKRIAFRFFIGSVLAAGLVGCSKEEFKPPEDKAPVEAEVNPGEVKTQTTNLDSPDAYVDVLEAKQPTGNAEAFTNIYSRVLEPLAGTLFDPSILANREYTASAPFAQYLEVFHRAILQLQRLDARDERLKKQLETYEAIVLKPCLENRDSCRNLRTFARDRGYVFALQTLNETLGRDPVTAWKYLLYSLDFAKFPETKGFGEYALSVGEKYFETISERDPAAARAEINDFVRLFNQVVLSSDKGAAESFFDRLDIWSDKTFILPPERKDAEAAARQAWLAPLRKALWPILIDNYAYEKDGTPTRSFRMMLDDHGQKLENELFAPFKTNPRWARVADSFSLNLNRSSFPQDLLNLLDLAFTEKFPTDDVLTILRTVLKPSQDELLDTVEAYVQLRFMWMVLKTQDALGKTMGNPRDYTSIKKLGENLRKAIPEEEKWARFQDYQMAPLQLIVETYLASFSLDPSSERIQKIFIRRDENIKRFAIYPNMLPIVFYVSKGNMRDTLKYLWWSMTIDSDLVFELLFGGSLESWFNFTNTNRDRRLSASTAVQAFHHAVLTQNFEAFDRKPSEFLLEAVNRLTTKSVTSMETASASLITGLFADYEERGSMKWRSHFMKITDTCLGKANYPEQLELKDLRNALHGHFPDMMGNIINMGAPVMPIYWFQIEPTGRQSSIDSLPNLTDNFRTKELFFLDQLEEMTEMYHSYIEKYDLQDERVAMEKVDAAILKVKSAFRKYLGLTYQAIDRYDECHMKIVEESRSRQMKVMEYEEVYLRDRFEEMKSIAANPSLMAGINQSHIREFPEMLGYKSQDRFEVMGSEIRFMYTNPDFLFRLRDFLQKGYTSRDGTVYPPIAPNLRVNIPANPLVNVTLTDSYRMFFSNDRYVSLTLTGTPEEFVEQAFAQVFWVPSDSAEYQGLNNMRVNFGAWGDTNNLSRLLPMQLSRVNTAAVLIKLGETEIYDFEKPGCTHTRDYAYLNENCLVPRKMDLDHQIAFHERVFDYVQITPEKEIALKKTHSAGLVARNQMKNVFLSELTWASLGLLDPLRFAISSDALGNNINYPGSDQRNREGIMPRYGYLPQALDFYETLASVGDLLVNPRPEVAGDVKGIYQSYVDREFGPLIELDKRVEELKKTNTRTSLYYSTYTKPLTVPVVTEYSPEPGPAIKEFNNHTKSIFARPEFTPMKNKVSLPVTSE